MLFTAVVTQAAIELDECGLFKVRNGQFDEVLAAGLMLWRAVDAEGEVIDVLVQAKRNKRAALKLVRKLLKKYGFVPDKLVTDDLRLGLQPVIWGSRSGPSEVDGATTEPRIRINRPGDENARCKVSRAPGQRKDFSQSTPRYTTHSTSNAISFRTHRAFRASAMDMWHAAVTVA